MTTKAHTVIDVELYNLARKQMDARKLEKAAKEEAKGLNEQIEAIMERYLDLDGSKLRVDTSYTPVGNLARGPMPSIEVNIVQGSNRRVSKEGLLDAGVSLQQIDDATMETAYTQVRVKYV